MLSTDNRKSVYLQGHNKDIGGMKLSRALFKISYMVHQRFLHI